MPAVDDEKARQDTARAQQLLAGLYLDRRSRVARGYTLAHHKLPRGLHHALSARDPATRRRMLHPLALVLLSVLEEEAETCSAASSGARRVFGKSQGYYASRLGLSMRRGRNGEANGARYIRTLLRELANVGLVKKGGRCWFDGPGRYPRLVLWLQPWEQSLPARFADALASLQSRGS